MLNCPFGSDKELNQTEKNLLKIARRNKQIEKKVNAIQHPYSHWELDRQRPKTQNELVYWAMEGYEHWATPLEFNEDWFKKLEPYGLNLSDMELSQLSGMTKQCRINPTHWFSNDQMWWFINSVTIPRKKKNCKVFFESGKTPFPIKPIDYAHNMNEIYCFEETIARETNLSMGWFVYYEFIQIIQSRSYWSSRVRRDNAINYYMTPLKRFHIDHANIAYLCCQEAWNMMQPYSMKLQRLTLRKREQNIREAELYQLAMAHAQKECILPRSVDEDIKRDYYFDTNKFEKVTGRTVDIKEEGLSNFLSIKNIGKLDGRSSWEYLYKYGSPENWQFIRSIPKLNPKFPKGSVCTHLGV